MLLAFLLLRVQLGVGVGVEVKKLHEILVLSNRRHEIFATVATKEFRYKALPAPMTSTS